MSIVDDLILAGYTGYRGWDPAAAAADFQATGGAGKIDPGSAGGGQGGGTGGFEFDYEAEAQKAYGELGAYYDRILKESQGDMNKALARMTEDYDRGVRVKKEEATLGREALTLAQGEADRQAAQNRRGVIANALSRGLYQRSAFDTTPQGPDQGFGIPSENLGELAKDKEYSDILRRRQGEGIDRELGQYLETSGIQKSRQETDMAEAQRRREFEMEQQRRTQAGELANTRAGRAYQRFSSALI